MDYIDSNTAAREPFERWPLLHELGEVTAELSAIFEHADRRHWPRNGSVPFRQRATLHTLQARARVLLAELH